MSCKEIQERFLFFAPLSHFNLTFLKLHAHGIFFSGPSPYFLNSVKLLLLGFRNQLSLLANNALPEPIVTTNHLKVIDYMLGYDKFKLIRIIIILFEVLE